MSGLAGSSSSTINMKNVTAEMDVEDRTHRRKCICKPLGWRHCFVSQGFAHTAGSRLAWNKGFKAEERSLSFAAVADCNQLQISAAEGNLEFPILTAVKFENSSLLQPLNLNSHRRLVPKQNADVRLHHTIVGFIRSSEDLSLSSGRFPQLRGILVTVSPAGGSPFTCTLSLWMEIPNGGNILIRSLLLTGTLLAASILSVAQNTPPSTTEPTWDLFTGGTFQRGVGSNSTPNYYGWDTSVSEHPYRSHPWIGGTLEASGSYKDTNSTESGASTRVSGASIRVNGASIKVNNGEYSIMGGPSVVFTHQRVRPFARVLVGGIFDRTSESVGSQSSTSTSSQHFGTALGGGVDISVAKKLSIRGQADWLRYWASNSQSGNIFRTSAGVVFRF
jgi:opacity protein-like surface antigen